jgi:hypothetical protein
MNKIQTAFSAVLCGWLLGLPDLCQAGAADRLVVPDALKPPAEQVLLLTAQGVGAQIYACSSSQDDPNRFSWTLKAPQATLRSRSGKVLGKHYAGPTWEAADGSKVIGEVVAKSDAPDARAIPWLLLRAKSTSGSGRFATVLSVQRLRTAAGLAPSTGCDQARAGHEVRVPYSAEYRFYGPAP